jgi:Phage protein Gp19/Gp15/Gp42
MAFQLPGPYADVDDLQAYWRTLTQAEQDRASVLLDWAAQVIGELPDHADFSAAVCAHVSMDAVKRAMLNGDGVTSQAQSMADISVNQTFVNPMGNLYLTGSEIDRLYGRSSRGRAFSLTLTSNAAPPPEPWNRQPSEQGGNEG